MSDKLFWFPFYIDVWETDSRVRVMGPVARSYYLILLMLQWREGHIPESRKTLLRLLTLPSDPLLPISQLSLDARTENTRDMLDYEAILDQVLACFAPDGRGSLVNETLKSVRDDQLRVMLAKSKGGKHSSKNLKRVKQDSFKIAGVKKERELELDLDLKREGTHSRVLQESSKEPSLKYTARDYVERDLRNLSKAKAAIYERLKGRVGCDEVITEKDIHEEACVVAGITVERGLFVEKQARKWPQGASA